jgi:hypothetical protein
MHTTTASEDSGTPQDRDRLAKGKRLGWGLLVGVMVVVLPLLASKLNSIVLLLIGEILGWPGAIIALVLGGWNARPFTSLLYYSVNIGLYAAVTYFALSMREKRKRSNRNINGINS